jgi:hypothetical protein
MPSKPHGIELDPIKIGFLLDWEVGVLDNLTQPFELAFEEAYDSGVTNRRIELVIEKDGGPRTHTARDRTITRCSVAIGYSTAASAAGRRCSKGCMRRRGG